MRSNAHILLPLWGILQTYNAQELNRMWRYVFTGAHPVQLILSALRWLFAVPLQSLKIALAQLTSLVRLRGVETQPALVALGDHLLRLVGFKLPTPAPLCRLPVRLLPTPEQKRAGLIKAVKKRIQEQIYALIHTVNRYKVRGF